MFPTQPKQLGIGSYVVFHITLGSFDGKLIKYENVPDGLHPYSGQPEIVAQ